MRRLVSIVLSLAFTLLLLSGCQNTDGVRPAGIDVYYINPDYTSLEIISYLPKSSGLEEVEELLSLLSKTESEQGVLAPLSGIKYKVIKFNNGELQIEFGGEYNNLTASNEVLVRSAVVMTLLSVEDITSVEFLVGDKPLTDVYGAEVGKLSADSFVEYFGKEQASILHEDMMLYYSTADGNGLRRIEKRVYFDPLISLEQAVLTAISSDAEVEDTKVAFPRSLKNTSVTTSDGVCYMDLDISIIIQAEGVSSDVVIYSIVNSICELSAVHAVQLNVVSADDSMEKEAKELSGLYEKNNDLVVN